MDRPKEAIEEVRKWSGVTGWSPGGSMEKVFAYLDWLEGKHVVDWPKELTRERLEELAFGNECGDAIARTHALRALAAIAPVRKKRVVNLWMQDGKDSVTNIEAYGVEWNPNCGDVRYRKVAGPIELEE